LIETILVYYKGFEDLKILRHAVGKILRNDIKLVPLNQCKV